MPITYLIGSNSKSFFKFSEPKAKQHLVRWRFLTFSLWMYFLLIGIAWTEPSIAATYKVDPERSTVSFEIRNFSSWVPGSFYRFEGTIVYEPEDVESSSAWGTIEVQTIDTRNEKRDRHLRLKDFFYIKKFPSITFKTTQVEVISESKLKVRGLLIIRGVERSVVLDVGVHDISQNTRGKDVVRFSATTMVNRKDFGMTWNAPWDLLRVALGDEARIALDISAILVE